VRPEAVSRKEWIGVALLLALALALRVGFVLQQPSGFYFEDSLDFDTAARTYLETGHFDARYYRSPVYPLLLAGSYRLFGPSLTPFRLLQALLSIGICACVWVVGRRCCGARTGLIALAATAIFPVQVVLPGIEYPMVPGTLLIWVAFAIFARSPEAADRSIPSTVVAALAAALAMQFFEGGMVAAFFLILWALAERRPWRARLRTASVILIVGLAVLTPWLLRMTRTQDYRPLVLRAGMHLPAPPGTTPPLWQGSGGNLLKAKLTGLLEHPGWVIHYSWREFWHFWDPYPDRLDAADAGFRNRLHEKDPRMVVDNPLVGDAPRMLYAVGFTLLLAAALLGALVAGRAVPGAGFLTAWPVVLGACYAPFFTQMRYRIPADPALIILAAYAAHVTLRGTLLVDLGASLRALWGGWKRIAEKIAAAQTFILLLVLFYLVLGPTGVLMKLFRQDPVRTPRSPGSFWGARERTREAMKECSRQF
jgi:4-amino-4-deoxy-L-arabinose transferase-like glycosyltransferase